MKKMLSMFLTAALVLCFSACGETTTPNSSGNESSSSTQTSNRTYKETLNVVVSAEPTSLDGLYARNAVSVVANQMLYDYLVYLNTNTSEISPMLAESWEYTSDTELVFHLRKDVVFHNGQPLTADDVVYSMTRVRDLGQVTWASGFMDKIEKVDDYTVSISFLDPCSSTVSQFGRPGANIVCAAAVEADPDAFKTTNPVGTGPYKLVEWNQGNYIRLERNEEYWGNLPAQKYINIKIVPESSQRLIALENGEADIAYDIAPSDVAKVENNTSLRALVCSDSANVIYLSCNTQSDTPLSDKRVRQAIQYAIDKEALNRACTEGYGKVAHTVISPGVVGFKEVTSQYNVEKAKELLTQAGYPNGFAIDCYGYTNQTQQLAIQILENMLSEVNIKLNLNTVDYATLLTYKIQEDHQLFITNWFTMGDAYWTFSPFFSSSSNAAEGNDALYHNDEVDDLVQTIKTSFDEKERDAAFDRLYEITGDELPYIALFTSPYICATSANVENFNLSITGYHRLDTVLAYN